MAENMPLQGTPNRTPSAVLWIVLSILVIGVIGLSYYLYQKDNGTGDTNSNQNANVAINGNKNSAGNLNSNTADNQNTNTQSANANSTATSNANVNSPTSSGTTYRSDEFQFRLSFPPEWDGYTVAVYRKTNPITNTPQDYSTVVFEHPKLASSDGRPGKVQIAIYVLDNPGLAMPNGVKLLTESGGVRYGYSRSTAATPGELQEIWNQIEDIAGTFSLL